MNIIANNCCGGWLYTHNKMEYTNPFMWSITQYDSLIYLLGHFYDINWTNIKISESALRKHTYKITVDGMVNIHYMHCVFNKDKTQPTKIFRKNIGNDIDYCLIWEYVYDKYIARTKRMIKNGEPPIFLLRPNNGNCNWTDEQINTLLTLPTPFKRILISQNQAISSDNSNNLILYTTDYPSHSCIIQKYLSDINRFIGLEQ